MHFFGTFLIAIFVRTNKKTSLRFGNSHFVHPALGAGVAGSGAEGNWTEVSMFKFILLFPAQLPLASVCLLPEQRWQIDMVAFVAWRGERCGLCELLPLLLTACSSGKC